MKTITSGYDDFMMPDWLLYCNTLGGEEKLTYTLLRQCSEGKDHAYPTQEWLSDRLGRSVRRYLKNLEDQGFILTVRKKINGNEQDVFFFLAHPIIRENQEVNDAAEGQRGMDFER
jgi:hypothetical protein